MIEVDEYVLGTLMRDLTGHDRQPSAFLVYLTLWRLAQAGSGWSVQASLREVADATGLSRRAVQSALARLHKRKLIGIERAGVTAVPVYTVQRPWAGRRLE
jgi:hypothetical protein